MTRGLLGTTPVLPQPGYELTGEAAEASRRITEGNSRPDDIDKVMWGNFYERWSLIARTKQQSQHPDTYTSLGEGPRCVTRCGAPPARLRLETFKD